MRLTAPVPGHMFCDQGLNSWELWEQIVVLGWHPWRYQHHVTFQPADSPARVLVQSLITGLSDLWVGRRGRPFGTVPCLVSIPSSSGHQLRVGGPDRAGGLRARVAVDMDYVIDTLDSDIEVAVGGGV